MGLEPISSPVKGECPNQLDERSIRRLEWVTHDPSISTTFNISL